MKIDGIITLGMCSLITDVKHDTGVHQCVPVMKQRTVLYLVEERSQQNIVLIFL